MDDSTHEDKVDPRRVWLANLPPKSTEFAVLQLVRPFGKILDFNFPVHQSGGPLQGSTLGYCFVTFSTEASALMAMKSLNGRTFCGAVLSTERARPTREAMAQWREACKEAQRARIEAERQRREEEVARRLADPTPITNSSALLTTVTPLTGDNDDENRRSSTSLPDLYGKLGLVSAKSTTRSPPPLKLSRAQKRQAVRRIEAALRSTSQIAVQPAILRSAEETRQQQPHPLVAALLAGGKRQQTGGERRQRGGSCVGGTHRFNPYFRP